MIIKLAKALVILILAVIVIFGIFYLIAPYVIRSRIAKGDMKADPGKFKGSNALPKDGRILFVTAHPDDLEFMAGGTLPKLLERGNVVYLAILTDGGKERYMPAFYSRRIVKTRHDEQLVIAKTEGLKDVFFINYPDGSLKYSDQAVGKIDKIVKEIKADYIFTFEPSSPDAIDGFRRAVSRGNVTNGGIKIETSPNFTSGDHAAAGQIGTAVARKDGSIRGLYYFRAPDPNIIIDTSDTYGKKIDTLFMFSEFLYKKRMLRAIHEAWDSSTGRMIGVRYGEAFKAVDLDRDKPEVMEADFTKEKTR